MTAMFAPYCHCAILHVAIVVHCGCEACVGMNPLRHRDGDGGRQRLVENAGPMIETKPVAVNHMHTVTIGFVADTETEQKRKGKRGVYVVRNAIR